MGKIFILLVTLIVIIIIGAINGKNNRRLITRIRILLSEINRTYILMFKEASLIKRLTQGGIMLGSEVFATISVIMTLMQFTIWKNNFMIDSLVKAIIILTAVMAIHFSVGYMLLMSTKIQKFICHVEDKNLKLNLILSYFIISTYFTVLIIFPNQFNEAYIIGLIGVAGSYLLNLKVLIKIMKDPYGVKSKKETDISFTRIIIAAVLLVIMIVLNLFLAVCFINGMNPNAFTNNPTNFELFYYTIITFTTVGYGDICPITTAAKVASMVISITSLICTTVFISTILSYKDKFILKVHE